MNFEPDDDVDDDILFEAINHVISQSNDEDELPPTLKDTLNESSLNLLPEKSKQKYLKCYSLQTNRN